MIDKKGLYLPVVEEFYSLQGEGYHTGKPAWFVRVGGCEVGCSFCDEMRTWNAAKSSMNFFASAVVSSPACVCASASI